MENKSRENRHYDVDFCYGEKEFKETLERLNKEGRIITDIKGESIPYIIVSEIATNRRCLNE